MPSLTPNTMLYLESVKYLPDRREIVVEFTNQNKKFILREKFFPKIHLSIEKHSIELIKELLSVYDKQKYEIITVNKKIIEIKFATFYDLKKASMLLQESLRLPVLIIEPERQFLIEKNWSYFDLFSFKNGEPFTKNELFIVPNLKTHFLVETIPQVLSTLLKSEDFVTAEELVECIILSNLLRISSQHCPKTAALKCEIFLENIFFKHKWPIPLDSFSGLSNQPKKFFRGNFTDLVKFDFSPLWSTLCTFPYFNLGVDTLNCECCKPKGIYAENISPASLVNVKFLQDGVYFQTSNKRWVYSFHISTPGEESRLRYMKEFGLQEIPAGPFFRNQIVKIPIKDAFKLASEGKIEILDKDHSLVWLCRFKESFLSLEINYLSKKISALSEVIAKQEKKSLYKHGLAAFKYLALNVNYFYRKTYLELAQDLLNYLALHLTSASTKFYTEKLVETIETVQHDVLKTFIEFSSTQGAKAVAASPQTTFMATNAALAICQEFSAKYKIPPPTLIGKFLYSSQ